MTTHSQASSQPEELKPCPFCNGAASVVATRSGYMVECNNAGCGVNPDAFAPLKHDTIAAWNRRAAAPSVPVGEAPTWGMVNTVADLVRNLLTLDQDAPIYTAFHVTIDGERRCRTRDITISRERVIDGKWIDSNRKDVPYANVLWAKPDERAALAQQPGQAGEDSALLDFLDTNARFRMGWRVGIAPAGCLSVTSIIMGGKPIREAIQEARAAATNKTEKKN